MSTETPSETSVERVTPPSPRMTRGAWIAAGCTVLCLAVMAAVVIMANRPAEEDPAREAASGRSGGFTNQEVFGRPSGDGQAEAAVLAACGPLDPDNPPKVEIELEGGLLDFGQLKQGVTVDRDVTFKNVGSGPLCIGKVHTGCGCLKAALVGDKERFEPGESGVIRVVADTTGRVGIIRKQVSVLCNDMKSPRRTFRVVMDVSTGLISEPRYLQFGNIPPGTPATRTLILRSGREEEAWKVLGIKSTRRIAGRDPVTYTFETSEIADPRYRKVKLLVMHPGYKELGVVRDLVVIETDHPDRPRIEVPAHIHVVPRIRSRSKAISLGFVHAGTPRRKTRARIVAGAPGVTFTITKVEVVPREGAKVGAAGPGFTATAGEDPRGWWVDVEYDGKTRGPGLLEAQLLVHTDDEEQPLLRIPIRATVRPPR
ncbi:MAG: DUF1573 domain-containing protein [Planctomycetota bacterium]|nr:DUF1573 domain-containing protein [Planctomycetota bacterium]